MSESEKKPSQFRIRAKFAIPGSIFSVNIPLEVVGEARGITCKSDGNYEMELHVQDGASYLILEGSAEEFKKLEALIHDSVKKKKGKQ